MNWSDIYNDIIKYDKAEFHKLCWDVALMLIHKIAKKKKKKRKKNEQKKIEEIASESFRICFDRVDSCF